MQRAVLDNFLEIKILGAVLVGAVLAMGRFGIDPFQVRVPVFPVSVICYNTSGLSDKCVPGLVSVMYNVLSSHAVYSRLGAATVAAA